MGKITAFRYREWSMKRKLFGYMFLLVVLLLLALISGLVLFGRFESAGKSVYEALDVQMEVFEKDVFTHFDRLAAASIQLSEDMTVFLEDHLTAQEMSFAKLNDSGTGIAELQEAMFESLRQRLLQENCSGVFVMLDATVNSHVADAGHSRTGLYLQQSGYKNSDRSVLLYRGLVEIGKRYGVMPHRKWQLEFRTDQFPNYNEVFSLASLPSGQAYLLTDRFTLPGTSDDAILVASPIVGSDGTFYGVCGYEVSASFFKTYHAQPTKIAHLTCLLATADGQTIDADTGLSCGVSGGYYRTPKGLLTMKSEDDGLLCFSGEELSYIGVTREISLSPNNAPYTLAVMMLKADYDRAVMKSVLQSVILWALLLFFAVSCCMYFSRRYLSPILHGLEQIKSDNRAQAQSSVPELNDLFVFLAEQDQRYEDSLSALAQEKQTAQSEKDRLQLEYEKAQLAYESAQDEYIRAQQELSSAKTELDRLAYSRKTEIDPDDYQHFLAGVATLTKMEREVFEHYLSGKSASEILALTGIKESTLKFHNHNILNKLGVSSRKQMLRFAALMKQQQEGGSST